MLLAVRADSQYKQTGFRRQAGIEGTIRPGDEIALPDQARSPAPLRDFASN